MFPQGPDGPLQLGIDFRLASVPAAFYYADAVSLRHDRDLAMALLSFGRSDMSTARLRDRLEVVMPEGALFFQFWISAREVEKTLDEQLKALALAPVSRPVGQKAAVRTTLFANVIFVTTGGGESCLDFYYLPVRDIHLAKAQRAEIGMDPIVRVLCSPALLKYFLDLCRPYASTMTEPSQARRSDRASAV